VVQPGRRVGPGARRLSADGRQGRRLLSPARRAGAVQRILLHPRLRCARSSARPWLSFRGPARIHVAQTMDRRSLVTCSNTRTIRYSSNNTWISSSTDTSARRCWCTLATPAGSIV